MAHFCRENLGINRLDNCSSSICWQVVSDDYFPLTMSPGIMLYWAPSHKFNVYFNKRLLRLLTCIELFITVTSMAPQITGVSMVCTTVCSGAYKKQIKAPCHWPLWGDRWPVNSPHKGPVTRKMFLFDDVIMYWCWLWRWSYMRLRNDSSLVQEMYCHLIGTKPLSKPLPIYHQQRPIESYSNKIFVKIWMFSFWKMLLNSLFSMPRPSLSKERHVCLAMLQLTMASLVRVMACRLFGATPLSEPMATYPQLDPQEKCELWI